MTFRLYQRLALWIRQDPMKFVISSSVIFMHLIALSVITFSSSLSKPTKKVAVVVKTTYQQPKQIAKVSLKKPPVAAAQKKQAPALSPPVQAKVAPVQAKVAPVEKTAPQAIAPQKAPASIPIKKPTAAKTPPTVKVSPSPSKERGIPKELLQELEERIAKIEVKRDKISSQVELSIPQAIDSFVSVRGSDPLDEQSTFDVVDSYSAFLVSHLQQHLQLPDFGEVKVEIVLNPDGSVERCVVLRAESNKNKTYLEQRLPLIRFPDFKGTQTKSRQVFVLTFCNQLSR
jgi:outer membrane biosynthesis protein TonB